METITIPREEYKRLKKLEDIQKQAVEQLQKTKKPEDLKYIG